MTTNDTLIKVENLIKNFDEIKVLKGINSEIKKEVTEEMKLNKSK